MSGNKEIIESLKRIIKKLNYFESAFERIGPGWEVNLETDDLRELILDLLLIPKDNTTDIEHKEHWSRMDFCKDCFCRDRFLDALFEYEEDKCSYEEFYKKCRINLVNSTLASQEA